MVIGLNSSRHSNWDTRADKAWRQPALRYIYRPCIEKARIFSDEEMGNGVSGGLFVLMRLK